MEKSWNEVNLLKGIRKVFKFYFANWVQKHKITHFFLILYVVTRMFYVSHNFLALYHLFTYTVNATVNGYHCEGTSEVNSNITAYV